MQQLYLVFGFACWWTLVSIIVGYALVIIHRNNLVSRLFGWLSKVTDNKKDRKRKFS